jgi:hypothetical protein
MLAIDRAGSADKIWLLAELAPLLSNWSLHSVNGQNMTIGRVCLLQIFLARVMLARIWLLAVLDKSNYIGRAGYVG